MTDTTKARVGYIGFHTSEGFKTVFQVVQEERRRAALASSSPQQETPEPKR